MRFRHGRHNFRNVYLQDGDDPRDTDKHVAVFLDNQIAAEAVRVLNGEVTWQDARYPIRSPQTEGEMISLAESLHKAAAGGHLGYVLSWLDASELIALAKALKQYVSADQG